MCLIILACSAEKEGDECQSCVRKLQERSCPGSVTLWLSPVRNWQCKHQLPPSPPALNLQLSRARCCVKTRGIAGAWSATCALSESGCEDAQPATTDIGRTSPH